MTDYEKCIGAVIGLCRTIYNAPISEDTKALIMKAAAESDSDKAAEYTELLHKEKYTYSPDCATCASPCGRTFDFNIDLLDSEDTTGKLKKEIISALVNLCKSGNSGGFSQILETFCIIPEPFDEYALREIIRKL